MNSFREKLLSLKIQNIYIHTNIVRKATIHMNIIQFIVWEQYQQQNVYFIFVCSIYHGTQTCDVYDSQHYSYQPACQR